MSTPAAGGQERLELPGTFIAPGELELRAFARRCPKCGAAAGDGCTSPTGYPAATHAARLREATRAPT